MKALLVDPDPQRSSMLAHALQAGGVEISIATSASFALTMLEWNKQDVIISRARVGDMDGHELCAIVRSDPSTKDVRFVLVVGPGENAPSQTAAAGVDLLLPDALSSATMVTRVVELVRRQQDATTPKPLTPPTTLKPSAPASTAAPRAPHISPAPVVEPAAPAPPRIAPPPTPVTVPPLPTVPTLRRTTPPPPRVEPSAAVESPAAPPAAPAAPIAPVAPTPSTHPAPSVAPPATIAAAPVAPTPAAPPSPLAAPPSMAGLEAVGTNGGARTFQGALGVLEIEELTQAIAVGGKTGRLVLVLTTGGGLIVFESGRVTHAEFVGEAGESAFRALVAASHRERGGKFCFIPVHPNELKSQPKTIDRGVDQLLLDVAKAMDEERRA